MKFADWGTIALIVGVVGTLFTTIGRVIANRLQHIDECLDNARGESQKRDEQVRAELVKQQDWVRAELISRQETAQGTLLAQTDRLSRIEQNVAWMAGKMGIDAPPQESH